jgi:hypothetical protein
MSLAIHIPTSETIFLKRNGIKFIPKKKIIEIGVVSLLLTGLYVDRFLRRSVEANVESDNTLPTQSLKIPDETYNDTYIP